MYSRLKVILIILTSILILQFALPVLFSWKSDQESNSSDQPRVQPVQPSPSRKSLVGNFSSLPFDLPCVLKSKSAASAIERAKSVECKKELVEIACKMHKNQLYPRQFHSTCAHKEFIRFNPRPEQTFPPGSRPIKIAFILTLNGRCLRQIQRLINSIYDQNHIYFIHIDSRQNYLYHELKAVTSNLSNIYFAKNRLATIWGGTTLLNVLLDAFRELLKISLDWDYAINLSESDFPVKPLHRLESFLLGNMGFNFVKSHGQDVKKFIKKQGLDRTFHQCENRMWKLGRRKLSPSIKWDGGSDWIAITKNFAHYLVKSNDSLVQELLQIFSHTLLPAESFFHTTLHNSQFCHRVIDNNLHLTNWKRKSGCRCQHKHVVDWCGCSPNDYSMSDWPILLSTSDKAIFFARKFEPVVSGSIINRLESWLMGSNFTHRSITTPSFSSYWETIFHVEYDEIAATDLLFYSALQLMSLDRLVDECRSRSGEKFYSNYDSSEMSVDFLEFTSLHSVHLLFVDDIFSGLLVTLNVTTGRHPLRQEPLNKADPLGNTVHLHGKTTYIESFFTPKSTYHHETRQNAIYSFTLANAVVCSNFDRKELMFRNFACVLSSNSNLVIAVDWTFEEAFALSPQGNISVIFDWMHPNGSLTFSTMRIFNLTHVLEDTSNSVMMKRLDDSRIRLFVDSASQPDALSPGLWTLKMKYVPFFIATSHNEYLRETARVTFMMLPEISSTSEQSINYGKRNAQSHHILRKWFSLLSNVDENNTIHREKSNVNDFTSENSVRNVLRSTWKLEEMCHHQVSASDSEVSFQLNNNNRHAADLNEFKKDKSIAQNASKTHGSPEVGEEDEREASLDEREVVDDERDYDPYISGDAFYSLCLSRTFTQRTDIVSCHSRAWSSFSSDVKSNFNQPFASSAN